MDENTFKAEFLLKHIFYEKIKVNVMGFTSIETSYALHISHGSPTGLLSTLQG